MKYNVAVIGGGPAGMMAAGRAGELGASVILLEKNSKLGIKLLMTGGGRCNITNQAIESRKLVDSYGKNGKFLFSALSGFGVSEVIDFFQSRGVKIKAEQNGRVFPVSNSANDILKVLKKYLADSGVEIKTNALVEKIINGENSIKKLFYLVAKRFLQKNILFVSVVNHILLVARMGLAICG
jgi:predicted Rossmann fold flavoprotein